MNFRMRPVIRVSLARLTAAAALIALSAAASTASATVSSAAVTGGQLSYRSLGFAQHRVDASAGGTGVTLTWRLTDSDPSATYVAGEIDIRMAGTEPGTYIGRTYQIQYDLNGSPYGDVTASGTAQDSSYSFVFGVPRYANATTARWVVTKATALDDQGRTLSVTGTGLDRFGGVLTARELVDSTAPTYSSLTADGTGAGTRPYVYDNGTSGVMGYLIEPQDQQSGIWKGSITLLGPGGQTLNAGFAYTSSENDGENCGGLGGGDDFDLSCGATVTIPAGTPAGTWAVSQVTLQDNAGNKLVDRNLDAAPIVVTADQVMSARGFSATPNPVNDWSGFATVQFSMTVTGAQQGIAAIYLDSDGASPCREFGTTPTVNADGTVSVPVLMYQAANGPVKCPIDGVAIVDGAGHVALYGSDYGAPDPGVTISSVPDTAPPTATSASISPTSISASTIFSAQVSLTIGVSAAVAPVGSFEIDVYDSAGNVVDTEFGGTNVLTGQITEDVPVESLTTPGVYTVAFKIIDAGDLTSSYGYPNSPPVPGGPLQLTVTP